MKQIEHLGFGGVFMQSLERENWQGKYARPRSWTVGLISRASVQGRKATTNKLSRQPQRFRGVSLNFSGAVMYQAI